jgi:hypothetical protein
MNAIPKPKPKSVSTALPPSLIQADLRLNALESDGQIPQERRAECIALLRELMETVAGRPTHKAGGAND